MKPKRFGSWLNVPVSPVVRQQIERIATERKMAMSEIVREFLSEALETRGIEC